ELGHRDRPAALRADAHRAGGAAREQQDAPRALALGLALELEHGRAQRRVERAEREREVATELHALAVRQHARAGGHGSGDAQQRATQRLQAPLHAAVEALDAREARVLGLDVGQEAQIGARRAQVAQHELVAGEDQELAAVVDREVEERGQRHARRSLRRGGTGISGRARAQPAATTPPPTSRAERKALRALENRSSRRLTSGAGALAMPTEIESGSPTRSVSPRFCARSPTRRAITVAPSGP